jgi:hypothetical protein
MRRRIWLPLSVMLTACDALTPREHRSVHEWLVCEECTDGELQKVVQIGDRAVWPLAQALRDAPTEGKEVVREQTRALRARVPGGLAVQQEYVDEVVANYVGTYQQRAAVALRQIGTPAAHAALVTATRDYTRYRRDVMQVIGEAAGIQLSVVQGDGQSALVGTPVATNPKVLVSDSTNGNPIWGIQVVFQVDSGGGQVVTDSVRLTDFSGKAQVRWQVGMAPGTNVLRASAAGREVRFRATAQ